MKKRKLKAFVLPTLYVLIIGVICISVGFLNSSLNKELEDLDYSVSGIKDEEIIPVVSETTEEIKVVMPYQGEGVEISKNYYSKDDDETTQKNSLIYYENTYLANTGILYTSKDSFNIVAVLDGTVVSIKDNELLGKVVEIKHNNNLSTFYYSLSTVNVKENDVVSCGDIIGQSGTNKVENKEGTSLLFEVYYQGKTMDPEKFYQIDLNTLE